MGFYEEVKIYKELVGNYYLDSDNRTYIKILGGQMDFDNSNLLKKGFNGEDRNIFIYVEVVTDVSICIIELPSVSTNMFLTEKYSQVNELDFETYKSKTLEFITNPTVKTHSIEEIDAKLKAFEETKEYLKINYPNLFSNGV